MSIHKSDTYVVSDVHLDDDTTHFVRMELAATLCRLAALMPYTSDDIAISEFATLDARCSHLLHHVTGIGTWQALLDAALPVRIAAEEVAGVGKA